MLYEADSNGVLNEGGMRQGQEIARILKTMNASNFPT
jgi:hypothetical protein